MAEKAAKEPREMEEKDDSALEAKVTELANPG